METNQALVPTEETEITYGTALQNLSAGLENQARLNIMRAVDPSQYSAIEVASMVQVEKLRLVAGIDLLAVVERGRIVKKIIDDGLLAVHPENFAGDDVEHKLASLAAYVGISSTELSDTLYLTETAFPWLEENLGEHSVGQMWEELGKSKVRAIVPFLRRFISGAQTNHATVNAAVERIRTRTRERTQTPEGQEVDPVEAIREVLNIARTARNVTQMRNTFAGGDGTEDINAIMFDDMTGDGGRIFIAHLKDDSQREMLIRLMNGHALIQEPDVRRNTDLAGVARQTRIMLGIVGEENV